MNAKSQPGEPGNYVQSGWRGGLPRPHVAPPGPRSWALSGEGACAKLPAEALAGDPFGIDDSASDPQGAQFAKSVCGGCPLRPRCLRYGMENEPFGILGGLDAAERLASRGGPLPSFEERLEAARVRRMFAQGKTAAEVAEHYRVARRTIERWRKKAGLTERRDQPGSEAA